MEIYQFYLAVIPREGIIKKFGEIPAKLEVDFEKRTEDFLKNENTIDDKTRIVF